MSTLAFALIAVMLGAYVLLDGYDLGVGAIHLFVARTQGERAATMGAIGPFWNGNEVWLIASGGALFALFPLAYASAFSGFYLPFMVVLWLLMCRGIAMELRNHLRSELWSGFFDVAFAVSSALLALLFGIALGNIVRGVPLDAGHYFAGTFAFLLNPYALAVGLLALFALAAHGAGFVAVHVEGAPGQRAMRALRVTWPVVFVLSALVTAATFTVRSPLRGLETAPWIVLAPVGSLLGIVGSAVAIVWKRAPSAFAFSSLFLAGMVASAAVTIFPYLLPAYGASRNGVSIYDHAPSPAALAVSVGMIAGGLAAVAVYRTVALRKAGRAGQLGPQIGTR